MSQRQQLERVFEIDRQIRAGLYPNAGRLARIFEVSRRVVYTDRAFMLDRLGAPIVWSRERRGWAYSDPTWGLPSVILTEGEILAFFLSLELARKYLGTPLGRSLESALTKIARGLKGDVVVDLEDLRSHWSVSPPPALVAKERALLDLHRAINERRSVWIRYFTASRRARTERVVDPYHLYNARGDWYLIGHDHLRGRVRFFNVGRVKELKLLDARFRRDPAFSPRAWLGAGFQAERGDRPVEVQIRFDANQAEYIRERRWHETQKIKELADGGLILSLTTAAPGELKRWVLQYGPHAEVLKPPDLRQAMAEEVKGMGEVYGAIVAHEEETR